MCLLKLLNEWTCIWILYCNVYHSMGCILYVSGVITTTAGKIFDREEQATHNLEVRFEICNIRLTEYGNTVSLHLKNQCDGRTALWLASQSCSHNFFCFCRFFYWKSLRLITYLFTAWLIPIQVFMSCPIFKSGGILNSESPLIFCASRWIGT